MNRINKTNNCSGVFTRLMLSLVILASMLILPKAQAAIGTTFIKKHLKYKVYTEDKESKTGTVSVMAETKNISGDIVIPKSVENGGYSYSVTILPDSAFSECSSLMSITIPDSVTVIGVDAFQYCSGLTNIIIPESVTDIGIGAFSNCSELAKVTIPVSVTSIGNNAFFGCSNLEFVLFKGNAPELGGNVFYDAPVTIYYYEGTEGWSNPWGDRPTIMISASEINIIKQPASLLVAKENSATFTVLAYGMGGLSYQWQKDGKIIDGAINKSYTINNVGDRDVGSYSVVINNSVEHKTSDSANLKVYDLPKDGFLVACYQSSSSIDNVDDAESCITDTLRWSRDPIYESHSVINFYDYLSLDMLSQVHFEDPSLFPGQTFEGEDLDNFVLLIEGEIFIPEAGVWSFGVFSDDGFKLNITGDNFDCSSACLDPRAMEDTIASFNFPSKGVYNVRLLYFEQAIDACLEFYAAQGEHSWFNDSFRLVGDIANGGLAVGYAGVPEIDVQPKSFALLKGDSVTFSVDAKGSDPLNYQWYKDEVAIEGATEDTYTIENITVEDFGNYKVVVSNTEGEAVSDVAVLSLLQPPTIIVNPVSVTVDNGTNVVFTVEALNADSYQWYKDGVAISGATETTYSIDYVKGSDVGIYTAMAINRAGAQKSSPAVLSLTQPYRATAELKMVNGYVVEVIVTDCGWGYDFEPKVRIKDEQGDGAEAHCIVKNGIVTAVVVDKPGRGYSEETTVKIGSPFTYNSMEIQVSEVLITMHLTLGREYQLECTEDHITWEKVGEPFIAEDETLQIRVEVTDRGRYFRVHEVK